MKIKVNITNPNEEVLSVEAIRCYLPTTSGDISIEYGQSPLLSMLSPGNIRVEMEGGIEKRIPIQSGIIEVQTDSVIVLSTTIE